MAKQDDYIKTALRLPRGLHAKIQEEADKSERSMNSEIITRLEKTFESGDLLSGLSHEGRAQLIDFARMIAAQYPREK